ncbi:MAG TPA: nucleoside deaminase [Candidatus Omnitrophota bacterium]|nr:nucleoside deaminase [Candidatus Omnitrophota bacterium]HPT38686.1 nucleoside deaminase [Candidatus Omnitrophota bacterium]
MKNHDLKFMRLAIAYALQGVKQGQTPFGAVIVKNNKVIAVSHNLVWKQNNIILHAEMVAIGAACKKLKTIDLSGCTIYSTTEPCPMCFSACHWARISRIVSGCAIKDAKSFGFNEMAVSNLALKKLIKSKIKITSGFAVKENIALFKFWQAQTKAHAY